MKTKLLGLMLLAGSSAFAATHFSVGIGAGSPAYYPPVPAAVVSAVVPPSPGPGYTWVAGYYDPYGGWVPGYWAPPAVGYYAAPRIIAPPVYRGYYDRDWDRGHEHFRGHEAHGLRR